MTQRQSIVAGVLGLMAFVPLVACIGPSMPGQDALIEGEFLRTFREIRDDPSRIERYPDLIAMQLAQGDAQAARESGEFCTEHNPSDPRAWLVRADVERRLLDLRAAERALQTAHRLDSRETLAVAGLAALYADLDEPQREAEWREHLLALAADTERDGARLGLARAWFAVGQFEKARELMRELPLTAGVWLLRIRLALVSGDERELEETIRHPPQRDGVYFQTLLRLTTQCASVDMLDRLRDRLDGGLADFEDPTTRFVCLFGLWQIGWLRSGMAQGDARPADHSVLWNRIDQIDSEHPEWNARLAAAVATSGDEQERTLVASRVQASQQPLPVPYAHVSELVQAWAIEDALRLGVAARVLGVAHELATQHASAETAMLEVQVLLSCRRYDEAAKVATAYEHASAAFTLMRLGAEARLGGGKAVLKAMEEGSEALKAWMPELAWVAALANYYDARE